MAGGIAPALRLIRLPGCASASVDSLTSALCTAVAVGIAAPDAVRLGAAAACSFGLYAFGIADGDLADVEKDRRLHPGRPIPAGAISRGTASRIRWFALAVALAAAAGAGRGPLVWAVVTALAILLHQRVLRRTGLGPVSMAACRVTNHAIGAALVAGASLSGWPAAIPLVAGVYVAALTALSEYEEPGRASARIVPALLLSLLTLSLLPLAAVPAPAVALAAIAPLFALLAFRAALAHREASARTIGPLVGAAVKGLVLIDAAFLLGFGLLAPGVAAIALWLALELAARHGLRT